MRREYPERPLVGVSGVILLEDRVVLVRRKFEPLAGHWSLPGGMLELGETLEAGTAREILEETGLQVEVGPVVDVFENIVLDGPGRVRYHFVLVNYVCTAVAGPLRASSDVGAVELVEPARLRDYSLQVNASRAIDKALSLALRGAGSASPKDGPGAPRIGRDD